MSASSQAPGRFETLRDLRLALAGGGTGGHVVPGMHLLECLQGVAGQPAGVLWFGAGRKIEERVLQGLDELLPGLPLTHVVLELEAIDGGAPGLRRLLGRLLPAVLRARRELRAHHSQLLVGLGGYTSLPAVLAARSLGIPICLLEINAVRGKATRWLSPLAQRVFHAWPSSLAAEGKRHMHVGPPLASAFLGELESERERRAARGRLGFSEAAPLLLVLGGSQGAAALNSFVVRSLDDLLAAGIGVMHQVGPGRLDEGATARPGYLPLEYLDQVQQALAASTLVLCRGGASTLAEIAARACPSIVIPYPHHADAHQEKNAKLLGAGVRIVAEERLGGSFLLELLELIGPQGASERTQMRESLLASIPRNASERICSELALLLS